MLTTFERMWLTFRRGAVLSTSVDLGVAPSLALALAASLRVCLAARAASELRALCACMTFRASPSRRLKNDPRGVSCSSRPPIGEPGREVGADAESIACRALSSLRCRAFSLYRLVAFSNRSILNALAVSALAASSLARRCSTCCCLSAARLSRMAFRTGRPVRFATWLWYDTGKIASRAALPSLW